MRTRLRNLSIGLCVALAAATACGGPGGDVAADCTVPDTTLAIGGGATGGLYFSMGATLATLLEEETCASGSTLAGSANEFFRDGADVVFTQTDQAYAAYSGEGGQGFEPGEQYPYLMLGVGWANSSLLVTRADAPIGDVRDLTPADVVATTSQASADALAEVFRLHGVAPQVTVITDFDQMFTALRQGQITVANRIVAHPESTFVEVDRNLALKPVHQDPTVLEGMLSRFPDYSLTTVDAGVYDFLDRDYPTFSRQTVVVVQQDLDDSLAREAARLLYERTDAFTAVVPFAGSFDLDTLRQADGLRMPFHPGAAAYFAERGVTVPST